MNLDSTTDLVRLTNTPACDLNVHASWTDRDRNTSPPTITPGHTNSNQANTAETNKTIVGSPANATTERKVEFLSVTNVDSADTTAVTINLTDGTTSSELVHTINLAPGERLVYAAGVWFVFDANGAVKTDAVLASDTSPGRIEIAVQSEMESGADVTLAVTPGRQHFHPGSLKAWGKAAGAGTSLTVNYNIASVADTGTGRLGVTIATDFSTANYSIVATIERGVTTLGAVDVEDFGIRNASPTAGVFEIESYDHTATTMAADDPANYFWMCAGDQA